jgi:hypothetical protein
MKEILLVVMFAIGFFAQMSNADNLFRFRPQLTCYAADAGWEEHWGAHKTCSECLSHHGRCNETCSQNYYRCTVVGETGYGNSQREMEFVGFGNSRWEAERDARNQCWRAHASGCNDYKCNSESEVVSRKGC